MTKQWAVGLIIALMLTGCGIAAPEQPYVLGDVLLAETFSAPYDWDTRQQGNIAIGVEDGAYLIRSDVTQYVRGFNNQRHDNVVIEVKSRQLSMHQNNAYGVICRASPGNNASGYYFLIGGDGSYSIRRGADHDVDALVNWAKTNAVEPGPSQNSIRAICVDDYLALYVNGKFVAQVRDSSYKSGFAGFTAAVEEGQQIEVTFDDLTIWSASLVARR